MTPKEIEALRDVARVPRQGLIDRINFLCDQIANAILPHWICHETLRMDVDEEGNEVRVECGTFNGAAKEWLTHCRACGVERRPPKGELNHWPTRIE